MATKVTTPKHLSNEAGELYRAVLADFTGMDALGRKILTTACESLDRMREAQAVLKKQGLTVRDRNGIVRPHPCTVIERNSRSALLAAFRSLHLEPPKASR